MNLASLKVGDEVLVSHGSGFNHYYTIDSIERETKTQWIVRGANYYKKDGSLVGNRYRGGIEELTEQARADFAEKEESKRRKVIWREIRDVPFPDHLTAERMQAILDELTRK